MPAPPEPPPVSGAEALARFGALDDLFEHRARLAIGVLLSRNDQLSFSRLKHVLDETDGSLGTHLRKLEESGYVAVRKEFQDRRPVSWYRLTSKGRKVLLSHLDGLAAFIKLAR